MADLEAQLGHPAAGQTCGEELSQSVEELRALLSAKEQVRKKKSLSKTIRKLQSLWWREKKKIFERRDNRVQLECQSLFSKSFLCWPKHTDQGSEWKKNGVFYRWFSEDPHLSSWLLSSLSLWFISLLRQRALRLKHCVLITHTEMQQNRSLYVQWIWEWLSEAALVWLSWCQTIVLWVSLRPYEPQVNVHPMHAEHRCRSVFPRRINVNEAGERPSPSMTSSVSSSEWINSSFGWRIHAKSESTHFRPCQWYIDGPSFSKTVNIFMPTGNVPFSVFPINQRNWCAVLAWCPDSLNILWSWLLVFFVVGVGNSQSAEQENRCGWAAEGEGGGHAETAGELTTYKGPLVKECVQVTGQCTVSLMPHAANSTYGS